MIPRKTCPLLVALSLAPIVASCTKGTSQNAIDGDESPALMTERVITRPPMRSTPPVSLDELETKIEKLCPIDLDQWRRTYAYTRLHDSRRYSNNELTFTFDKGPYADLRPSRSWRDILEVVSIDDRPGIEVVLGRYNLKTGAVTFERNSCPDRQMHALSPLSP